MKKLIGLVCILLIIFAASALTLDFTQSFDNKNEADSNTVAIGYKFTVKNFNGKVAVFSYGSTYPIEVLECPVSSLPPDEAQKVKAGIDIADEADLQQIIEAFD